MASKRPLSSQESALIRRILEGASFEGDSSLDAQVETTWVTGGLPTLLDLEVVGSEPAAGLPDGPIPVRAFVEGPSGSVDGEVMVWVKDGYLSGLEFAWVTDEAPDRMPSPDQVRLHTA
jgi:hypothetical protein